MPVTPVVKIGDSDLWISNYSNNEINCIALVSEEGNIDIYDGDN
jgi:hypothetical protein